MSLDALERNLLLTRIPHRTRKARPQPHLEAARAVELGFATLVLARADRLYAAARAIEDQLSDLVIAKLLHDSCIPVELLHLVGRS